MGASILGLAGGGLAISSGPACTFDLVEPRLDAGTASSSSSGTGGSTVDDHVSCLFGAGDEAKQSVSDLAAGPAGDFALVGPLQGSMVFGDTTLTNAAAQGAAFIAKLDGACEVVWAKSFSSAGAVDPEPVVAADGARLIAAGAFHGAADLAGAPLSSAVSNFDAFVVGFDPRGSVARVLQLGGGSRQDVGAAAAVGATDWVVAGKIGDELWWGSPAADGGAPLLTLADGNMFVMRIEEDAAAFRQGWVRGYGDPAPQTRVIGGVAVDGSGNIAVVGAFQGTFGFGGACGQLESPSNEDMFVVKLDPDGNCLWAHAYGSEKEDKANAVAFDSHGNLVLIGDFKVEIDFGAGLHLAPGDYHNAALVKLDANGTTVWSLGFGDAAEQHGEDVAVAADDTIYIVLDFDSGADFDPEHDGGEVATVEGDKDVLVASFDPDGGYRWARRYGNAAAQHSHRVGVDSIGVVSVAGIFEGTLETSAGAITGDSLGDAFAMRLGP